MEKLPIGIQDFGELRRGGYVYVDKTELIHRMVTMGKPYFLSRPPFGAGYTYVAAQSKLRFAYLAKKP